MLRRRPIEQRQRTLYESNSQPGLLGSKGRLKAPFRPQCS